MLPRRPAWALEIGQIETYGLDSLLVEGKIMNSIKISLQPPIDTLTGSSCPPPKPSKESAKEMSPLLASPRVSLQK